MVKKQQGFATMDSQRVREIASAGGLAAHANGTAHQWTSEQAREAGRKGAAKRAENLRRKRESGVALGKSNPLSQEMGEQL